MDLLKVPVKIADFLAVKNTAPILEFEKKAVLKTEISARNSENHDILEERSMISEELNSETSSSSLKSNATFEQKEIIILKNQEKSRKIKAEL